MDQAVFESEQVASSTNGQTLIDSTVDQQYTGASGIHQTVRQNADSFFDTIPSKSTTLKVFLYSFF